MDLTYVITTLVFFIFMAGLVQLCDALRES